MMAPNAIVPSGGGLWRRNSRRRPTSTTPPTMVRTTGPTVGRSSTDRARFTGGAFDQRSRSCAVDRLTSSARAAREHGRVGVWPLRDLEAFAAIHRDVHPVLAVDRRGLVGAPEHLALVVQARVVALGRRRIGAAEHR